MDQMSNRRYDVANKSLSPIQKDPNAPTKPDRQYGVGQWEPGYSMGRVSSDSNSSRLSHSNDMQRDVVSHKTV